MHKRSTIATRLELQSWNNGYRTACGWNDCGRWNNDNRIQQGPNRQAMLEPGQILHSFLILQKAQFWCWPNRFRTKIDCTHRHFDPENLLVRVKTAPCQHFSSMHSNLDEPAPFLDNLGPNLTDNDGISLRMSKQITLKSETRRKLEAKARELASHPISAALLWKAWWTRRGSLSKADQLQRKIAKPATMRQIQIEFWTFHLN